MKDSERSGYFVQYRGTDEGLFFDSKHDLEAWMEDDAEDWDIESIYEVGQKIALRKETVTRYHLPNGLNVVVHDY